MATETQIPSSEPAPPSGGGAAPAGYLLPPTCSSYCFRQCSASVGDAPARYVVLADREANDLGWRQQDHVGSGLLLRDAELVAEAEARRLAAFFGGIQLRRWSCRLWRVTDPGEGGVECRVEILPAAVPARKAMVS